MRTCRLTSESIAGSTEPARTRAFAAVVFAPGTFPSPLMAASRSCRSMEPPTSGPRIARILPASFASMAQE